MRQTYLCTFLLPVYLEFPGAAVSLSALCRRAEVNDGILKSLLVIEPRGTVLVKLALEFGICLGQLAKALLRKTEPLL